MFVDSGLKYDCNLYLPKQEGLRPFVNWNGLIRIPYFWEDGGHMLYGDPWTPGALGMDRPGLKIFNFHPVHIFLNTEKLERYREAKPHLKDAEKLRGATAKAAHRNEDAKIALGKADRYWKNYTNIMDGMFIGANMLRSKNFKNWHVHDVAVTQEYTDLGGDAN